MSYKYVILVPLFPFFTLFWLFLNRNQIDSINSNYDLLSLLTSYAGYNSVMLHGTIYTMLYLLILNSLLPNNMKQLLIRMNRQTFIKKLVKKVFSLSFVFVSIFTSVNVLLVLSFVKFSHLIESFFFVGVFISFICTTLLYILIGLVFCSIYIILFSEVKSLFFTFIITTLLVCGYLILGWNTPFKDIVVYDYLLTVEGLDLIKYLYIFIKNIILIFCVYYLLIIIFKEKDILYE